MMEDPSAHAAKRGRPSDRRRRRRRVVTTPAGRFVDELVSDPLERLGVERPPGARAA